MLLSVTPEEPLAFWTGGFDVSLYAQSKGFTTLEKTKAGQVFSALMLYSHWKPLGSLWNHLSLEFVKNCGDTAHVFFRVQDPVSVLERQELREISSSRDVQTIIFHPMINRGNAVDVLDIEELQINSGEHPRILLKNTLVKICQKNLRKIQTQYMFIKLTLLL